MTLYRKKTLIDAFRFCFEEEPAWWREALLNGRAATYNCDTAEPHRPDFALIMTLEGDMRAHPGDWIARGVKGELYAIKPDIFAETYEAV